VAFFDKFYVRKLSALWTKIAENESIYKFAVDQGKKWKRFYPESSSSKINEFILSGLNENDAISLRDFVDFEEDRFLEYCKLQDAAVQVNQMEDSDDSDDRSHQPTVQPDQEVDRVSQQTMLTTLVNHPSFQTTLTQTFENQFVLMRQNLKDYLDIQLNGYLQEKSSKSSSSKPF
jgi:uncharacterized membrane protein YheB (UPF0754 family)